MQAKTLGLYLQTSYDLTTQLTLNGGIRHECARLDISDHIPLAETWFMPEASRTPLEGAVRKYDDTLFNLGLVSVFYNESDKTIDFNADHNVDLLDQKRKVYGLEGAIEYFLNDYWYVGGTYAFTEGRSYYKEIGEWLDLQAAGCITGEIYNVCRL